MIRVKAGVEFEVTVEEPTEIPLNQPAKKFVSPFLTLPCRTYEQVLSERKQRKRTIRLKASVILKKAA